MKSIFVFFVSLLLCCPAVGQQSAFVQYNTGDGLAQSQVRAMAWDDNGYLWFGTMGGISRFDGYEFVNFTKEDGLPDNQINDILNGSKLWVGTTGAIVYVDGLGIHTIPFPGDFAASKISDMLETADGALWLALAGDGLLKYSEGEYRHFGLDEGLPDAYVRTLSTDRQGRLWIGTRSGVVVMEEDRIVAAPIEALSNVSVSDIDLGTDGEMVVCTFGHGVYVEQNGKWNRLTTEQGLPSNDIRCVQQTAKGEFWFGGREGLTRWNHRGFTTFDEKKGMPYSNVKTLATDREGNLWIGTDGQGALRRTGRPFTYYTTEDGLISNPIMDICALDSGRLVFATYDRGLSAFDGRRFSAYPFNDSLPSQTVWQVDVSATGVVYAATSRGLFIENRGTIQTLDSEDGIPGDRITALWIDDDHRRVWVGAEHGFAQLTMDGQVLRSFNASTGFFGKRIRHIIHDRRGLWIAAEGEVYRLVGDELVRLPAFLEPETAVYALYLDRRGALWIGTSDGLYVYETTSSDPPVEVEYTDNFSGQNVNWLSGWKDRELLIGTNNGMYRLNTARYHDAALVQVKHYSAYEGLISSETNQNAVLALPNEIWFGTTMGAVRFSPSVDEAQRQVAPRLNLSGIQLFLEDVDWSQTVDSLSPQTGLPVNPRLNHKSNYLSFNYAGIYLSNPNKVRYRYKLEGVDPHWLGPTKSRTATYAYLSHGSYEFVVQAFQIDNPELVSERNFAFSITPPFYLTHWFFALTALVFFAAVYALYRFRIAKEHEKQAAIRLEMQSRMMQLETRSLNSSMNRHFIFNALNSIQYYINMQDRRSANRYLTNFARLIRKNLDTSQRMNTTLSDELERLELYLSLEKMRFADRFEYKIEVADGVDVERIDIPAMLLQPFLENSIWHGILPSDRFGCVRVKVEETPDAHRIVIEDNGVGIDHSLRHKRGSDPEHVSQGVDLTVNRIRLYKNITGREYRLEGPFDRSVEENVEGTRVVIVLPKPSDSDDAVEILADMSRS